MKKVRRQIEPQTIRGDVEFFNAYGVPPKKQAEMRDSGLPCYHDGKCYVYFPEEVNQWIKKNWKLNLPNI
jgi:hypothetical protein